MGGKNVNTPRAAVQRQLDELREQITQWFVVERLSSVQMIERLEPLGFQLTYGQLHVAIRRFGLLRAPTRRPKGIKNTYQVKPCVHCHENYQPKGSHQAYCEQCAPRDDHSWWRRIQNFGVGKREFVAMLKRQNNACGICKQPLNLDLSNKTQTRTVIDHDHVTGKVRSLTHHWCNIRLVESIEYHERCVEYLRAHGAHETHSVRRPS